MDGRKALTPGTKLHFQNRNGGEGSYTAGAAPALFMMLRIRTISAIISWFA